MVEEQTPRRCRSGTRGCRVSRRCSGRCFSLCRRTSGRSSPSDVIELLKLVWQNRGINVKTVGDVTRLMTMSIADLLDDWFESPQVKSAMAVNGVIGTWAGPYEPGTAYVMAHHSIGDVGDGHLGNWGFPEGGMGAVADAIK